MSYNWKMSVSGWFPWVISHFLIAKTIEKDYCEIGRNGRKCHTDITDYTDLFNSLLQTFSFVWIPDGVSISIYIAIHLCIFQITNPDTRSSRMANPTERRKGHTDFTDLQRFVQFSFSKIFAVSRVFRDYNIFCERGRNARNTRKGHTDLTDYTD